ncbi:MAG TPA: sugar phosphate isomerase/epimerase family protein [Burkholderiaceae bacterium]|nr:sugar phosphate isomerase/epimerase family protein [Burkholderiaceae bacterium]
MKSSAPRIGFSTNVFDNPADIVTTVQHIIEHFTDLEIELEDDAKDVLLAASAMEYRELTGKLARLLAHGNRQISVHAPYLARSTDLAASDESIRAEAIRQVTLAIRFCADVGGDRVTYHPGFQPQVADKPALTASLKRSIEELQQVAGVIGVRLCLENMGAGRPKYLVYSPAGHVDLHRDTGTEVTLDLVHLATWCETQEEMDAQMAIYAPITANIHVNDMPAGKHRHVPLGEGVLPIAHMLQRMRDLGYSGAAIIDEFARPNTPDSYLACTKRFLLHARQESARHEGF